MKNRNVKGQGIVLKRVSDIDIYAEFSLEKAFRSCYDKTSCEYMFKDVNERHILSLANDFMRDVNDTVVGKKADVEAKLLTEFWEYNEAYSVNKKGQISKVRKDFCLIKWFKPPSDYTSGSYIRYGIGFHWIRLTFWVFVKYLLDIPLRTVYIANTK